MIHFWIYDADYKTLLREIDAYDMGAIYEMAKVCYRRSVVVRNMPIDFENLCRITYLSSKSTT